MKISILACLALSTLVSAPVHAVPKPSKTAAPLYSIATTPIGTLLDDPRARVIVDRHIPNTSTDKRIYFARSMTLKSLQRFANGQITDRRQCVCDGRS